MGGDRLPLSSASSHQPEGFRLALHSVVDILKINRVLEIKG